MIPPVTLTTMQSSATISMSGGARLIKAYSEGLLRKAAFPRKSGFGSGRRAYIYSRNKGDLRRTDNAAAGRMKLSHW